MSVDGPRGAAVAVLSLLMFGCLSGWACADAGVAAHDQVVALFDASPDEFLYNASGSSFCDLEGVDHLPAANLPMCLHAATYRRSPQLKPPTDQKVKGRNLLSVAS